MRNSDQLRFMFQDVVPPEQVKKSLGEDLTAPPHVGAKKYSPKEARLVFYSNLASQTGPSVRVQRPRRQAILTDTAIDNAQDLTDNFMKDIDFDLGNEPILKQSQRKSYMERAGNSMTGVINTFYSKKTGLSRALSKPASNSLFLKRMFKLKFVLLGLLFVIFICSFIYGINRSNQENRERAAAESRAQAEWDQTKKQWECTVARYEAKQNNKPLQAEKEKICADIN